MFIIFHNSSAVCHVDPAFRKPLKSISSEMEDSRADRSSPGSYVVGVDISRALMVAKTLLCVIPGGWDSN